MISGTTNRMFTAGKIKLDRHMQKWKTFRSHTTIAERHISEGTALGIFPGAGDVAQASVHILTSMMLLQNQCKKQKAWFWQTRVFQSSYSIKP